ncbi:bolA-like protein DDB_G0274169 [Drosophila sulfurigaster albostrigata]|uniref:bolA-like protein DDB_G0274169 n=1 Tax=Drosophila sulfurigaster albostrigata TaxID=89887 RepID=UPI002D2199A5|nr:bolA-like protein DDB_G0274169 [Drosophila sulfurigaster albostrigata]
MFGVSFRHLARVSGRSGTSISKYSIAKMSQEKQQYPPIETAMRKALTTELKPLFLDVSNESPMHNTPKQAESHFRVLVVSDKFNDLTLIKRHRLVNDTIKKALEAAGFEFMHALSIEAKTPKQWQPDHEPEKSPPCLGGFDK